MYTIAGWLTLGMGLHGCIDGAICLVDRFSASESEDQSIRLVSGGHTTE